MQMYFEPVFLIKVCEQVFMHGLTRDLAIEVFLVKFLLGLVNLLYRILQLFESEISPIRQIV